MHFKHLGHFLCFDAIVVGTRLLDLKLNDRLGIESPRYSICLAQYIIPWTMSLKMERTDVYRYNNCEFSVTVTKNPGLGI